jgi:hypothetical protein
MAIFVELKILIPHVPKNQTALPTHSVSDILVSSRQKRWLEAFCKAEIDYWFVDSGFGIYSLQHQK